MLQKIILLVLCSVMLSSLTAFSQEFNYEKEYVKMFQLENKKSYSKALKQGMKIRKQELTPEQSTEIKEYMLRLVESKRLDDALKTFSVSYDKYENFYKYEPMVFSLYSCFLPVIFAGENGTSYQLKVEISYNSRRRLTPTRIILHADGQNLELKPYDSSDYLFSSDTYRRLSTSYIRLKPDEVEKVALMARGGDVSYKVCFDEGYQTAVVSMACRNMIENGYLLYKMMLDKTIKAGAKRF